MAYGITISAEVKVALAALALLSFAAVAAHTLRLNDGCDGAEIGKHRICERIEAPVLNRQTAPPTLDSQVAPWCVGYWTRPFAKDSPPICLDTGQRLITALTSLMFNSSPKPNAGGSAYQFDPLGRPSFTDWDSDRSHFHCKSSDGKVNCSSAPGQRVKAAGVAWNASMSFAGSKRAARHIVLTATRDCSNLRKLVKPLGEAIVAKCKSQEFRDQRSLRCERLTWKENGTNSCGMPEANLWTDIQTAAGKTVGSIGVDYVQGTGPQGQKSGGGCRPDVCSLQVSLEWKPH